MWLSLWDSSSCLPWCQGAGAWHGRCPVGGRQPLSWGRPGTSDMAVEAACTDQPFCLSMENFSAPLKILPPLQRESGKYEGLLF